MSVVVTTNEPQSIKELFTDRIELPMGFDILLYTKRFPLPIERKAIPGDLLSSVQDGRLAKELRAMREVSKFQVVLLHGRFTYNTEGELVGQEFAKRVWTKKGIRNLLRTLRYVEGVYLEYAEDDRELVEVVNELQEYFDEKHHLSMRVRQSIESNWFRPSRSEQVQYFYQGLPSIKAVRAKLLSEKFPDPINLYSATIKDLMQIRGIGRGLATEIYTFLREG